MAQPTVGVFALQGDVREHVKAIERLGAMSIPVRRPEELARCDALILPGGESTTMFKLARTFELTEPIQARIQQGMPVFGTCAGMIMLATKIVDGVDGQESFGGLDATVRRNAFGRQVDSFEGCVDVVGLSEPVHAVFIRAPWIEEIGPSVQVLASVPTGQADRIVAVRQEHVMATSFHPEVGDDDRLHQMFLDLVKA